MQSYGTTEKEIVRGALTLGIVVTHGSHGCLEVCGCLLLDLVGQVVNLEPIEPGHKLVDGPFGPVLWVNHEQHVREPCAEIGPVCVVMPRGLWGVDVHALWAIELDHGLAGDVAQADGQHLLVFAIDAWTVAKVSCLIFLNHLGNAAIGQDVTRVDESVQQLGRLLDEVRLVWIVFQLVVRLQI